MPRRTSKKFTRNVGGRPSIHPWDKWIKQLRKLGEDEWFILQKGKDFQCSCRAMAEQIWRYSRNHEIPMQASIVDHHVYLRLR